MSDSQNWNRSGRGIARLNAFNMPVGEKVNYFTPAAATTVLEINPGPSGLVVVEVEGGSFRCKAGLLDARTFTAEADDDKFTIAGHPYRTGQGPLRVEQTKMMTGDPSLTFDMVVAANDTLVRAAGNWTTDGFAVSDVITVTGSVSNNSTFTIAAITTTSTTDDTLEFTGDVLADEAGVTGVRIVVGALPTGLLIDTDYWIRDVVGDAFRLGLTRGGVAVALTADGTLGHLIGGSNGVDQNVGFAPAAPVADAANVTAIGAKKLRTDEVQVFDTPVTIVGETGTGDLLAWWTA